MALPPARCHLQHEHGPAGRWFRALLRPSNAHKLESDGVPSPAAGPCAERWWEALKHSWQRGEEGAAAPWAAGQCWLRSLPPTPAGQVMRARVLSGLETAIRSTATNRMTFRALARLAPAAVRGWGRENRVLLHTSLQFLLDDHAAQGVVRHLRPSAILALNGTILACVAAGVDANAWFECRHQAARYLRPTMVRRLMAMGLDPARPGVGGLLLAGWLNDRTVNTNGDALRALWSCGVSPQAVPRLPSDARTPVVRWLAAVDWSTSVSRGAALDCWEAWREGGARLDDAGTGGSVLHELASNLAHFSTVPDSVLLDAAMAHNRLNRNAKGLTAQAAFEHALVEVRLAGRGKPSPRTVERWRAVLDSAESCSGLEQALASGEGPPAAARRARL